LEKPQNEFVRGFIGGAAPRLRLLDLEPVRARMRPQLIESAPLVAGDASLKDALNLMLALQCQALSVQDKAGVPIGTLHIADLIGSPHDS
jgi:osmoprotectant transport system ATP-binding protein